MWNMDQTKDFVLPVEKARFVQGVELPKHVASFIEDGVYFGMNEDIYHDNPALGSSDMKRLAISPPDFWFNSKFNPRWEPDDDSPAKKLGRAAHKCVLEGHDEFRRFYAPVTEPGNTKEGKLQRERVQAQHKEWLSEDDYVRVELMGAMVRKNPTLTRAFEGGAGSEISIFWTSPTGIKKKCRIDYLKRFASVDLKTIANQFDEEFPVACRKRIANLRYDIQAAHYGEGRSYLHQFLKEGRLFGAPHLVNMPRFEVCAASEQFAWVFIFVQSKGAPLTWGTSLTSKIQRSTDDGATEHIRNPLLDFGYRFLERAEFNWNNYCEKFDGLGAPWVLEEPLQELSIDDFPPWSFK